MREHEVKSVNADYTGLPTVAELTPDGGGLKLKTTAHTRSRAVATALGSTNDSQGDGGADGEMERAKVEHRGRIWLAKLWRWRAKSEKKNVGGGSGDGFIEVEKLKRRQESVRS
jgi:hypothetical protein